MWTVAQLGADLAAGRTSSRDLVEQALGRIADKDGEGSRAFLLVDAEGAREAADYSDLLRKKGVRRSPVDRSRTATSAWPPVTSAASSRTYVP